MNKLLNKVLPIKKKDNVIDNLGLLKMERDTKEQHVFIVEQYFKNNESLVATVHKIWSNNNLTSSTVKKLIKKFRKTESSINDLKHSDRSSTIVQIVQIEAILRVLLRVQEYQFGTVVKN